MSKEVRPRLTEEEYELFKDFKERHKALAEECKKVGIDIADVGHYWYKGEHFSIFGKQEKSNQIQHVFDVFLKEIKEHAPLYHNLYYPLNNEAHLLVIDPADLHLNKLCSAYETGDEYNIELAKKRLIEGVEGILQKASGFVIDQILFISGNDKLHVDTPKSTTTSGTFQDTQVMWYDAFRFAVQLEVQVLEHLVAIAPVHYQYDPSNHDYTNGFFMAQTVEAWMSNCKHITFNNSIAHRKYFTYGKNLIGTSHGDGAKTQDLALIMAHEASKDWADCIHRYWYTHHLHHKVSKDYLSVNVETLRSPSGTDSWHHRNGYQFAPKAIEGFIHSKEHGQICRITHLF